MQPSEPGPPAEPTPALVIPVIVETLRVDKQTVETGRVVLHKTVHTTTETADVPLRQETVQVQRVAVNRYVDEAPAVRYEGDTMIVAVLREEMVITKRLLLVEELHVHTQVLTTHAPPNRGAAPRRNNLRAPQYPASRVALRCAAPAGAGLLLSDL